MIGLEYRFGLFRGAQVGSTERRAPKPFSSWASMTSSGRADTFPIGLNALAAIEGVDNFQESYSPTLGVLLSREIGDYAALYVEPMCNNSNPQPEELIDDNDTFVIGLGARLRFRPTVCGRRGVTARQRIRSGRHAGQLRDREAIGRPLVSVELLEWLATTFAQIARAAVSRATTGTSASIFLASSSEVDVERHGNEGPNAW